MREVEPAHVIALTYAISNDGASDTCARLTLRLSDPRSPLQGRTFDVELPPATNGHAEFVIPQHRFLASVHRMWKRGDRCQVLCSLHPPPVRQTCHPPTLAPPPPICHDCHHSASLPASLGSRWLLVHSLTPVLTHQPSDGQSFTCFWSECLCFQAGVPHAVNKDPTCYPQPTCKLAFSLLNCHLPCQGQLAHTALFVGLNTSTSTCTADRTLPAF